MTDQTSTVTELDPPVDPAVDPQVDEDQADPAPGRREAKYRHQLREVEAERDTLRTRVETLQRAEAERMTGLEKPAALWAAGATLVDLLDEHGDLDPAKVAAATTTAQATLGVKQAPRRPRPNPAQGQYATAPRGNDWEGAFAAR